LCFIEATNSGQLFELAIHIGVDMTKTQFVDRASDYFPTTVSGLPDSVKT